MNEKSGWLVYFLQWFSYYGCIPNYPKYYTWGSQLHNSTAGGGKNLKSCSFRSMAVDAGLCWGPRGFSTLASLYGPTRGILRISSLARWTVCPRASTPKDREPDGSYFAFCPSLGSHQTSCLLVLYLCRQSQAPTNFKQREYRPHLSRKESKSHIVRKVGGIKDLCCGHLEKYNLPHLRNRQKWSH